MKTATMPTPFEVTIELTEEQFFQPYVLIFWWNCPQKQIPEKSYKGKWENI